jgi:hypothetical protein
VCGTCHVPLTVEHILLCSAHASSRKEFFLLTVLHLLTFLLPFPVMLLLVFSKKLIFFANCESLSTSLRLHMFWVVFLYVCFL